MSTPDYSGRHEARPSSDPWSPQTDPYTTDRSSGPARDDRFSPYYGDDRTAYQRDAGYDQSSPYYRDLGSDPTSPYRELGNDRTATYYRDLADDRESSDTRATRDTRDDFYEDAAYDRDVLYDQPSSNGAARHFLSAFLCLILTPIGIAAMTYGTERYAELSLGQAAGAERDLRGLVALGAGACVLLIVAWLGALSPSGPLLSGVSWGLVPAGLFLAYPSDTRAEVSDLPALPDLALTGIVTWLGAGAFLMLGVLLVGAGLAAVRRRQAT